MTYAGTCLCCAFVAPFAIATSAEAAVTGLIASVRIVGSQAIVDVFVGMDSPDRTVVGIELRGVGIATSAPGQFVQGAPTQQRGWAPDLTTFTSTRDSLDSFLTVGRTSYGDPSGSTYANPDVVQVGFPSGTWVAAPISAPANAVPANASWFSSQILNPAAQPESLAGLQGRVDVNSGAAGTGYGVWIAHLVVADLSATIDLNLKALHKDAPSIGPPTMITIVQGSFTVPAPATGAVLAMVAAAIPRRRRREN